MSLYNQTWGDSTISGPPQRHVISRRNLQAQINLVGAEAERLETAGSWLPQELWYALDVSQRAVKSATTTGYKTAVSALSDAIQMVQDQYVELDKRTRALQRDMEQLALEFVQPVTKTVSQLGMLLALGGGALFLLGAGPLLPVLFSSSAVALGAGVGTNIGAGIGVGIMGTTAGAATGLIVSAGPATAAVIGGGGGALLGLWLYKQAEAWKPEVE